LKKIFYKNIVDNITLPDAKDKDSNWLSYIKSAASPCNVTILEQLINQSDTAM
jgi:hypothetical protein